MLKKKLIIIGVSGLITLSSCGIFHKNCHCPKFSKIKKDVQMCKYADVQIC